MAETLSVTCCIAGGGPAGMMLGLLLARAGIEVAVLEKHADFLRDFRGDTIHPSTLELMHELGLLEDFLKLPHQEVGRLRAQVGHDLLTVADFTHLPTHCRFIALMPQWDFLDFLAREAARYPGFRLLRQAQVTGLIEDGGRVAGVRAETPDGPIEVRAPLTVGADGRHSTVRQAAGLAVETLGAPMDVLWFRLPRHATDPADSLGHFEGGRILIQLDRGEHWQCAYVIAKGAGEAVRAAGLPAFRDAIGDLVPFARDRLDTIADWDQVKLLTVAVDRLTTWHRPGLLCIGDAAHAMSPIGGVGINLAIQDAVAAANLLAAPLKAGHVSDADLAQVQRRRAWPTRVTQGGQILIQNRIIAPVLNARQPLKPALPLRLIAGTPWLRRLAARAVGMGVRPEHVQTPVAA